MLPQSPTKSLHHLPLPEEGGGGVGFQSKRDPDDQTSTPTPPPNSPSASSAPSALKFPRPIPPSNFPLPTSKHWLFAPSIPLPPLPDSFQDQAAHDRLLSDYLDWTGNYVQLAQKHGLDFDTFDRWLHSDLIQSRIKRMDAMSDLRAKTLAKQHRAVAITRLVEIVEDTRASPVRDRVRAASQILKAAEKADNRELREAKAAAQRALTKVANAKTEEESAPTLVGPVEPTTSEAGPSLKLTSTNEPLPEGRAAVGPVQSTRSEAGRPRKSLPPSSPLPSSSPVPRSEFPVPRFPYHPPKGVSSCAACSG